MMRRLIWPLGLIACLAVSPAAASSTSSVETAGTAVAIAMPIFAAGVSWGHDQDWTGVAQLGVGTLATVGTAFALKNIVHEERPDHSDDQSFPSDTAALAFAPAAYLWDRYGWQWGVPAYAAAAFVGWSRVDAKKHHWYDVAASAGIAWGFSQVFTTEYRRSHAVYSDVYATPDGAYVRVSYNF
jgi:membrane-associated phospholipid phosphatase